MPLTPDKERAANYETVYALTGDRERSYKLVMTLPDPDKSLESSAAVLSGMIGKDTSEIIRVHRAIADSFASERIATRAIFPESPLFPVQNGEYFPVIYASGDLSLLNGRHMTVLGMPKPSMQGRSDTLHVLSFLLSNGITAMVSLDEGIPRLVAETMLGKNGKVIAVLSGPISRCSSESEAVLRGRIYASGLLLSVFPPMQKTERWLVMIRNSFMASVSECVLLTEEKDGGPSWSVFDKVLASGGRAMLSSSMMEVPSYTWAARHIESGALTYSSEKDLRRLVPKAARSEDVPDLFS